MRHIWSLLLSILFFLLFYGIWNFYNDLHKSYHVKIAASGHGGTYKVAQAIAAITHKHYPEITIDVISTLGSGQSQKLITEGLVDLAMIQADTKVSGKARLVSLLYPDAFQLIVRKDSAINAVADLRGKLVAVAHKSSGQYSSFWELVKHYGLGKKDIYTKSMSSSAADFALKHNSIDAIFRVHPAGNAKTQKLIKNTHSKIIPITQAKALHLSNSALIPGLIPKGTYQGDPPVPKEDLETVMVYRLLIAHEDLAEEIVRNITTILFEQKQALQSYIKLAGLSKQPDRESGTMLPIHEGAQNYFNREEPSLIAKYLDKFGFLLTIFAVLSTILMSLRAYLQRVKIHKYNKHLMKIIKKAQFTHDKAELTAMAEELNSMLETVLKDKRREHIDHNGFEQFSFYWEMARDEVNEELLNDKTQGVRHHA